MLLYANVDETDSLICSDSGCKLCETQRGRCVRIGEVKLDLRRYFLEHFLVELHQAAQVRHRVGKVVRCVDVLGGARSGWS